MPRAALQLTCLVVAFALCAAPGVDARELDDTKVTLSKQRPERPHLGLPATHVSPRAPGLQVFMAPGVTPTPRLLRAQTVQESPGEDAAPENAWRARAHPSQAPPVKR